jgi:hypothetical protein
MGDNSGEDRLMRNCTFTPKVKGISARMASAKVYLSTDVVERLTRSGQPSPRDPAQSQQLALGFESEGDFNGVGDRPVMDVASFMGTQQVSYFIYIHTHINICIYICIYFLSLLSLL